jgi:hypothetical protein
MQDHKYHRMLTPGIDSSRSDRFSEAERADMSNVCVYCTFSGQPSSIEDLKHTALPFFLDPRTARSGLSNSCRIFKNPLFALSDVSDSISISSAIFAFQI